MPLGHGGSSVSDIRHLEEASHAGLPALRTDHYDGWLLRFANGYSRRANSVAPLASSTIDLDEKISYCERAYARAGLPCVFKLTQESTPDGLEALTSRGYRRDAETLVCTCRIGADVASAARVELFDTPEGAWFETWLRLTNEPQDGDLFGRLLAATPSPAVYALIRAGDEGVACAGPRCREVWSDFMTCAWPPTTGDRVWRLIWHAHACGGRKRRVWNRPSCR